MNPLLQKRFDALETSRHSLCTILDSLNVEEIRFQPQDGKWSIVEVLQHVIWAEEGAYRYMMKKNQAESLPKAGIGASLRALTLKIALKLPIKYQAPEQAATPDPAAAYAEIKSKWEDARKNLQAFLDALPPERLDVVIFRHPFAGYFNIHHTLTFFEEHFQHHLLQIERIRKSFEAGAEISNSN